MRLPRTASEHSHWVLGVGDALVWSSQQWPGGREHRYRWVRGRYDLLDAVALREIWPEVPSVGAEPIEVQAVFRSVGRYVLEVVRTSWNESVPQAFTVVVTVVV